MAKYIGLPDKGGKLDINVILEAVVVFIVIGISLLIIGPFTSVTSVTDGVETFTVTDDTIDQTLTLDFTPSGGGVTVEKFNQTGWSSVNAGFISVSRDVVTVDKDGI